MKKLILAALFALAAACGPADEKTTDDSYRQFPQPVPVLPDPSIDYGQVTRLSWEAGGDIDVHLVRAGAELFDDFDCYHSNQYPEWGNPESAADNPFLTDDATGAPGVESIYLELPEPGVTYSFYAFYFEDSGLGSAEITARVLSSGEIIAESVQTIEAESWVWHVGDLTDSVFTAVTGTGALFEY